MRRTPILKAVSGMTTNTRHYDTIVVGAGIAGLSCASKLFQNPKYGKGNALLVLEARDRIGGRIGSVNVNGCRLDTGANWIHGVGTKEKPNPLMEILPHKRYKQMSGTVVFGHRDDAGDAKDESSAAADGWEDVDVDARPNPTPTLSNCDQIVPSDVAETVVGALWGMVGSLHETASTMPEEEAKCTTMLKGITESELFRDMFEDVPGKYHRVLSGMPQFLENMEAAPLAAQSAEHIQDHAGMSMLEFAIDDFDGDQVFLQDGYIAIVEEVARDLVDAEVVKLGVEVEQIVWDSDPITIKTSSGGYTAINVVCTLPLGILKERQGSLDSQPPQRLPLFQPSLPKQKNEAISSLSFGTLDKIFLVYSRPWWTEEPYLSIFKKGIVRRPVELDSENDPPSRHESSEPDSFMGFTQELPGIEIQQDGTTVSGARVLSVINLHSLTGFPVLSCFVSCGNALQVEAVSDPDAGAIVHRALTTWLGREPPNPDAVHVTRWAEDMYAKGSYSHMNTGVSETKHREEFQLPVDNGHGSLLRFAGEHTSKNHFATVHGALLSGWREANGILDPRAESSDGR